MRAAAKAQRASGYDLSAHQTLSRAILLIRENYVEPERIRPYDMFLAALDYIQRLVPEVMVDDSQAPARVTVSAGNKSQIFDLGGLDQLWEVTMALRDIFRFLQSQVLDVNKQRDIEYAAINGMLSTLDPHSILLKPENFDEMKLSTKGEFGGLGIVISIRDGGLTIIAPIEGTPAGQAGLRPKDKIVKIGEESTVNMGLDEAVQLLRGKPDTQVTISVQRKGWTEPKPFVLTRAIIKIESVTSELLADGIGYVKIKSFQGNTFDDLETHLTRLKAKNQGHELRGLVMDLRNNPGGLLDQAILVSDRFISRGPLVITVGESNRRREVKYAHPGPGEDAYPMAVLLNGGSASASEIVAGALKNHNRAVVIGQQSFGKGSVQVLYDFKDRSALKLTIAQYLTPGDISIQSVGIVPDLTIIPAVLERDSVHLFVDDEAPREKDLDHHLSQHSAAQLSTSAFKLYRLSEKERDELDPTSAADEELATGKFDYDFETRLGHDMLLGAKSHNRANILKGAQALLEERTESEDATIAKRMGELGVNWEKPPAQPGDDATRPGEVDISLRLVKPLAVAGNTITLRAQVHNRGDSPLFRVFGTTQSDNPLLRALEFPIGKLAPDERRSWDVNIKLPGDLMARADSVTMRLGDAQKRLTDSEGSCQLTIVEPARPRFAFRATLDDGDGNRDGLLQPGESATLRIEVENIGAGSAEDVTVTGKNLSGIHLFLDAGRDKLGALKPGEKKIARLKFHVHGPEAKAQRKVSAEEEGEGVPQEAPALGQKLGLRLGIWDLATGTQLSQKVEMPVAAAPTQKPLAQLLHVRKSGHTAQVFDNAQFLGTAMGLLLPNTHVQADAVVGEAYRVALGNGQTGFVRRADLEVARPGNKPPSRTGFVLGSNTAAPELAVRKTSLVADGNTFALRGQITSRRPLLDMFVFVGEKKMYFRALDNLTRVHGLYTYAFNLPLKLKPGSNLIAMLVRENEDLVARHIVGVLRPQKPKTPSAVKPAPAGTTQKPVLEPAPTRAPAHEGP